MTSNERATNIREYADEYPVKITSREVEGKERLVIDALNEGGYNGTEVDLLDVLKWVKENMPELLEEGWTSIGF